MNITRPFAALTVAASMVLGTVSCTGDGEDREVDTRAAETTRAELRQEMRAAWIDHVTWTRVVLVATAAGLPDAPHATARLLRSQDAIGALYARFDGDAVGGDLASLLHAHVVAEADVLAAAQRGDARAEAVARATWEANGRAIADLLSTVDPRLGQTAMRSRLQRHLDQSVEEADARLAGDWEADVAAADRIVLDVEDLADVLSGALADRHPTRVGRTTPGGASAGALRLQLRGITSDHATWTRLVLMSEVGRLDDADVAIRRLLATQADLGDALRPHLGDDVADRLTTLLEEHVVLGLATVAEARAAQPLPAAGLVGPMARERWMLHADTIADLLAGASPAWDPAALRGMMRRLVDLSFAEVTARIAGDHAADVAAHDALQRHVVAMADVLADGAIARSPDRSGR